MARGRNSGSRSWMDNLSGRAGGGMDQVWKGTGGLKGFKAVWSDVGGLKPLLLTCSWLLQSG